MGRVMSITINAQWVEGVLAALYGKPVRKVDDGQVAVVVPLLSDYFPADAVDEAIVTNRMDGETIVLREMVIDLPGLPEVRFCFGVGKGVVVWNGLDAGEGPISAEFI